METHLYHMNFIIAVEDIEMPSTTQKRVTELTTKQLRRMLEDKSTELRSQLSRPSANTVLHASDDPYDSADWAGKSHDEWVFLQKNNVDTATLREIEDALKRLQDGTYGICVDCGIPIMQKRLEALPWALYCVTCQERHQAGNN